jgi:hypothetical protein
MSSSAPNTNPPNNQQVNEQDKSKAKHSHRSHRRRMIREARNKKLPNNFFQDLIEAENAMIANSSKENCDKLIFLYKTAAEYYTQRDKELEQIYVREIQKLLIKPEVIQVYVKPKNDNENPNVTKIRNQKNAIFTQIKMLITSQKEDLRKHAKEIIVQYQNNLKKFNSIYKKSDNEQQQSLCKNTKIKTFSNLILSDDNNGNINVNNEEAQNLKVSIKTEDDIKQAHKNDLRNNNSKRKMSYNISTRSDETINHKERRRKTFKLSKSRLNLELLNSIYNNNNNDNKNINNNKKLLPKDSSQNIIQQKAFIKNDMSEELMRFLKDYNKKLYFLFQKQIEESIRHLNNTLDKTYREKINKHFEFQDSMGEYQLMLEEAVDETLAENVKELISSLENEYNTDMETITNSENKKMQQITQHYAKKQLKNNVVIGNLNIETLGEIVNIFK